MKFPQFTISQIFAYMFVVCVIATGVGYGVSGQLEVSPLVFQLMMLSAPVLLVVVLSLFMALTRKRRK